MSQPSSTYSSYTSVSIALHWIIALLAFGQIGLMMISDEVSGSERGFWMMLHNSGGMLILALTLVRLLCRLLHRDDRNAAERLGRRFGRRLRL